jgi:hypothetical protein
VIVAMWAWRNRHDLMRWGRFAFRVPSELRSRDLDELVTEARARLALSADTRTRCAADLDITSFDNGTLVVTAPGQEPIAQVAREVLSAVPGVVDVRMVDNGLPTAASSTTVGSTRTNDAEPLAGEPAAHPG